jgi:hypothetical protein
MPDLSVIESRALGASGWTGKVMTPQDGGTLHVLASSNEAESVAEVLSRGRAFPVTSAGPQIVGGSGLTSGTTYRLHAVHTAEGGSGPVATGSAIRTLETGAGSGSVAISVLKRSNGRVAPDPVFFRASVSAPGVTEASDRAGYDESFHKVLYIWDFGDPGAVSDKSVNLPAVHNDLNRAYGKEVAHVFGAAGSYTVTCTAYDASGVLIGIDAMTVSVGDPDTQFPGEQTIVIDPDGQGDPGRHPEAQVVSDWDTAWEEAGALDGPRRILLKRGTTTTLRERLRLNGGTHHLCLSAWGDGPRPVIATEADDVFIALGRVSYDIVFRDLDFRGPWNSVTETGTQHFGVASAQENERTVLIDDCTLSGFGIAVFVLGLGEEQSRSLFVINNSDITDWGSYGVLVDPNPEQLIALLGTAIHQHVEAMGGGGGRKEANTNEHGPVRLSNGGKTHVSCCDLFSRNGWTDAGRAPGDQPCFRWSTSMVEQRHIRSSCTLERTAMEGGFGIVTAQDSNGRGALNGTNFVMDKCLLVGTARTSFGMVVEYPGVTIRNTIMVRPNAPMVSNSWNAWIVKPEVEASDPVPPDDPVEIYANTMVNLLDDRNRDGAELAMERDIDLFETFSFENNVALTPNAADRHPEDPLLSLAAMPVAAGGPWRPRYLGLRHRGLGDYPAEPEMNTAFATPPGSVGTYLPMPGSPVIDNSSGRVPVDDFFGRIRGEDPDAGAVEL